MLYLVTMEVRIPPDADRQVVERLQAEERQRAKELQRTGEWRHLWRVVGRYANVSVFDVDSHGGCTRSCPPCRSAPISTSTRPR